MLEHGGRLRAASRRYGISLADWVDLSTGIAPWPYPVPEIPLSAWQHLPEEDDGLEAAARTYYGAVHLLPVPGSQAAIQGLPHLRPAGTVVLPAPSYGEYAPAWRMAGHRVRECAADGLLRQDDVDVLMLANPNNPDGIRFTRAELLDRAQRLAVHGGWLVVDEAFADTESDESLAMLAGTALAENIIVLRSLGKFFGLAGARVGFCIAAPTVLDALREALGPWSLAHPARVVAQAALRDAAWQTAQRQRLAMACERLASLLSAQELMPAGGTALFQYVRCEDAGALHDFLAQRGILVRRFDAPAALRFGLPENEAAWAHLVCVLTEWRKK